MNGKLCCVALLVLTGATTAVFGGPYSIYNHDLVKLDWLYRTRTVIGIGGHSVSAIEYSVDGFIYGVNPSADTLERIDPTTGLTETIGQLGIDLDWTADLDEDARGQLWMLELGTGRLYTTVRTSGAAALHCQTDDTEIAGLVSIGDTMYTTTWAQFPPTSPGCGLEYLAGWAFHLEEGPEGWVHGIYYQWVTWHWGYDIFYRIHPTSGESEELGRFYSYPGESMWGLTFDPTEQPPPAFPIPALGWPGRALLTLLLAIAGITILTRFWTTRN